MEKFSKKEAIKFGWEIAKRKIKFFIPLLILVFGVSFLLDYLSHYVKSFLFRFLLTIIGATLSIIFDLGLINLLGFLALIIGLFWSIPTTMIAETFVYRKLSSELKV
jgi:hypothetical protein